MSTKRPIRYAEPDIAAADRRKFLSTCGKFAIVTPPAVTMLLSTSLNSTAVAASTGGQNNNSQGQQGSGLPLGPLIVSTVISLVALGTVIYRAAERKP